MNIFEEIGWFIGGLIIIGIIWFWSGGMGNQSAHEPFIKPLAPLNTGETYGQAYLGTNGNDGEKLDFPENPITAVKDFFTGSGSVTGTGSNPVLLSKKFLIDGIVGPQASDPQAEYVRIVANKDNVGEYDLSGLFLSGMAYGVKEILPKAATTFVFGSSTEESDVFMPPLGRAIITSGRSPVGASFRINMCTGYLSQFQNFTPDLQESCPNPVDELKSFGPYGEATCRSFVGELPLCRSFVGSLPNTISASCKTFVTEKLSYNACVKDHVSDLGFFKNEWRLFLGETKELWKNSQEVIRLLDKKGETIDAVTY